MSFAVVDIETTGLHARKGDQILSMAILIERGNAGALAFDFTFKPKRTLRWWFKGTGPVSVHGISRKKAMSAKRTFAEQADDIAAILRGHVFVAHNVNFDAEFINVEFERLGRKAPISDRACTGRMAATLTGDPRGYTSLKKACELLGIKQVQHHDALDDATCALAILQRYMAV